MWCGNDEEQVTFEVAFMVPWKSGFKFIVDDKGGRSYNGV